MFKSLLVVSTDAKEVLLEATVTGCHHPLLSQRSGVTQISAHVTVRAQDVADYCRVDNLDWLFENISLCYIAVFCVGGWPSIFFLLCYNMFPRCHSMQYVSLRIFGKVLT